MNIYLYQLIKQFKSATGTKNIDVNSPQFIEEFNEWARSNKIMGKDYISFIEHMGVCPTINSEEYVEIGKGKFDSIALDTGINMITPFSEGIKKTDGEIITADFGVYEGNPIIIRGNDKFQIVDTQHISRFLTHNPYDQGCIQNWEQLHNTGKNITVGVFGSIYDKDRTEKIKQLKVLRDSMTSGYFNEDYVTSRGNYYYAVSSAKQTKELVKRYRG